VVGGLAAVENVFPPIPADTAVAMGAFISHFGEVSALVIFSVTWLSNVLSASAVYAAGRTVGRQFFDGRLGQRLLNARAQERIARLYREHGTWGIFLSRFIPGARAVIPPFAGVAGLGAVRTLAPVAAASAIWYGTLTALVATLAGSLAEVLELVDRLSLVAVLVAAGAVTAAVILIRRRRRRRETS
jgi:membrane protein DedA with SNARE-associated domain